MLLLICLLPLHLRGLHPLLLLRGLLPLRLLGLLPLLRLGLLPLRLLSLRGLPRGGLALLLFRVALLLTLLVRLCVHWSRCREKQKQASGASGSSELHRNHLSRVRLLLCT